MPDMFWNSLYAVHCLDPPSSQRLQMFMAMEKGEHLGPKYPLIEWNRVRAFRLEPLSSDGKITLDGELVDYVPLQQYVWPKAANIMCMPGPY